MKNILALIGLLVIIAIGLWWYLSRPVAAPSTTTPTPDELAGQGTLYRIDQENSEVKFSIGEILRDKPFTAVGTTKNISGDIRVNSSQIILGTMAVNARTFKTDSPQRDGAIARFILKSESAENEFITFVPTGYNHLPTTIPMGTEFSFIILGDLTISGITKPVSFDTTMKIEGTTITGTASTIIIRKDFDLNIPNIPFVAKVDETFPVTISIVANQVQ